MPRHNPQTWFSMLLDQRQPALLAWPCPHAKRPKLQLSYGVGPNTMHRGPGRVGGTLPVCAQAQSRGRFIIMPRDPLFAPISPTLAQSVVGEACLLFPSFSFSFSLSSFPRSSVPMCVDRVYYLAGDQRAP